MRLDHFNDFRRIPAHYRIGRHVFGHYRAGSDNRIIANGHARINHRASADPDVMAYGDRFTVLQPAVTFGRVQRMRGCINVHPRCEHTVIANADRADVQHDAVEVGVKIVAQIDVIAVVAAEARLNISAFALTQQVS